MTHRFFIGALIWLGFIPLEADRNYAIIVKHNERPNYLGLFGVRSFVGSVCLFIMYPEFNPLWDIMSVWDSRWHILFEFSSFYLGFDPILSKKRGLKWNYKGKDSGILDDLPMWAYLTLKALSVVGLIVSLYMILR